MTPRRPGRLRAAIALCALLVALGTGTALGHAELATINPADGTSPTVAPTTIVATFTEPLDPAGSSIKLVDSGGTVVVEGSTVDASDAKTMRLALSEGLAPGAYSVRWTTKSALDSDLDRGTTTFTVTAPIIPPTTLPSEANASPSVAPSRAPASVAPSPSAPPTSPATSAGDVVIPVVVALVVLAGLGLWLLRGRSRGAR